MSVTDETINSTSDPKTPGKTKTPTKAKAIKIVCRAITYDGYNNELTCDKVSKSQALADKHASTHIDRTHVGFGGKDFKTGKELSWRNLYSEKKIGDNLWEIEFLRDGYITKRVIYTKPKQ